MNWDELMLNKYGGHYFEVGERGVTWFGSDTHRTLYTIEVIQRPSHDSQSLKWEVVDRHEVPEWVLDNIGSRFNGWARQKAEQLGLPYYGSALIEDELPSKEKYVIERLKEL